MRIANPILFWDNFVFVERRERESADLQSSQLEAEELEGQWLHLRSPAGYLRVPVGWYLQASAWGPLNHKWGQNLEYAWFQLDMEASLMHCVGTPQPERPDVHTS